MWSAHDGRIVCGAKNLQHSEHARRATTAIRAVRWLNSPANRGRRVCCCIGRMSNEAAPLNFPHGHVTGGILAAFFEVHRELGYGFAEVIYRRALAIALRSAGLTAIEEPALTVIFRGTTIGNFHPDLVVQNVVLVEVKAAATLDNYAQAQLLNYLKAAGGGVGMLLNFGREASYKRLVMGDGNSSLPVLTGRKPEPGAQVAGK
jgi:GxxExxY protein